MPDPVNLTGEITAAIDGAALRGHQLALAYVRDDGSPSVSFRGSTYVRSSTELAIWARIRSLLLRERSRRAADPHVARASGRERQPSLCESATKATEQQPQSSSADNRSLGS